jgi:predicted NBD/HSP70 family sugar kinase
LELLVVDFVGKTRFTWGYRYGYPEPDHVLQKIREGLAHLQGVMGEQWDRVVGIGLTSPLALHQWGDLLAQRKHHAQQALGQWEHINLQQAVQAMTDLPVEFAKDTTAACVAELVQGQGRHTHHFLYVFLGTFVGGGLVIDGHIVNGQRGNAGAIGSLPMGLSQAQAHGNEIKKPQQLLEIASGWQLEQALLTAKIEPLLAQNLAQTDAIMAGHYQSFTQPWLSQAANALAMTVASSAALVDLDAVVIDGSLGSALMDELIMQTQGALSHYSFTGMAAPSVLRGKVGSHARAIGGALLPLHAQFFPDKDIFLKNSDR